MDAKLFKLLVSTNTMAKFEETNLERIIEFKREDFETSLTQPYVFMARVGQLQHNNVSSSGFVYANTNLFLPIRFNESRRNSNDIYSVLELAKNMRGTARIGGCYVFPEDEKKPSSFFVSAVEYKNIATSPNPFD